MKVAHLRQESPGPDKEDSQDGVAEGDGRRSGVIFEGDELTNKEWKLSDFRVVVSLFFNDLEIILVVDYRRRCSPQLRLSCVGG